MGIFRRLFGGGDPPRDIDDATLRALADAGADLSRETETLFFLYFASETQARAAADLARQEGYEAELSEPPVGYDEWLCRLTRQMVPEREAIRAARMQLEALARSLDGKFDGWEAAVTR